MVGNSYSQRRLQRRADQQQHWRTSCLGRRNHRDLYLYQQLCAIDHHLSGYIYGIEHTASCTDLPNQYHGIRMPYTDPTDYGIQRMVGNSRWHWRLQRRTDQQ
jgi:hypothetical protein